MLLFPVVGVRAQEADSDSPLTYYLRMVGMNGVEVTVPFSERPEIRHENDVLMLVSDNVNLEYPDGALDYFDITTERSQSNVSDISSDASAARSVITNGNIYFSGGTPGASVTVVSIDGSLFASGHLDNDGSAVIPFEPQNSGIYVINSGNTTFKIIKK